MKTVKRTIDQFIETHGAAKMKRLEAEIARQRHTIEQVHKAKGGKPVKLSSQGNIIKFAACGDLHLGSLYEASTQLKVFAEHCAEQGVKDILVTGDVLDGWKVYRGQEFELGKIGFEQQSAWFKSVAPQIDGLTWRFITGNHDASFKNIAGVNVGGALHDLRNDWVFLGEDQADVVFKTDSGREYKVRMIHPNGGSAYALSYRPQKIVESITGGTKPNMLLVGHFHKAESIPNYRNVHTIQTASFQWQTPFMQRGGLSAAVGGWIIEVNVGTDQTLADSVKTEFVGFY